MRGVIIRRGDASSMAEHQPFKLRVQGPIPWRPTKNFGVEKVVELE